MVGNIYTPMQKLLYRQLRVRGDSYVAWQLQMGIHPFETND